MIGCEFCDELRGAPASRFAAIYGDTADSRIVMSSPSFVVMPTIGQLFQGSMLILPREHVETTARIAHDKREELFGVLDETMRACGRWGHPVYFEHGAIRETGGSCGIYHAHIHVVPLPRRASPSDFLPDLATDCDGIEQALPQLETSEQYLLFGDDSGLRYANTRDLGFIPQSQYFRRKLADRFAIERSWDWRASAQPEADLMASLSLFRGAHAAHRPSHHS